MIERKKDNGFTLIELLVVILIISVLSGIMLSTLNIQGTKAKSRDAQRVGDIKKIQTALEAFYMDYRYYPDTGDAWVKINGVDDAITVALTITEDYLPEIPTDPVGEGLSTGSNPCGDVQEDIQEYYYKSNTERYSIVTNMEVPRSVTAANVCGDLSCLPVLSTCYEVTSP